jgi:EAL domain-containing protein (putative c-di-GMP-specific phosphodiesterase class I)
METKSVMSKLSSGTRNSSLALTHTYAPQRDLLIYVNNLAELYTAYGVDCVRHTLDQVLPCRLAGCLGISSSFIQVASDRIMVDLSALELPDSGSDDLFLERIKAVLCGQPIQFGPNVAFINVEAMLGLAKRLNHALSAAGNPQRWGWLVAQAGPEAMLREVAAYREDMASAVNFFEQMRAGAVVLAFQPVFVTGEEQTYIYHECLLRRLVADDGTAQSCEAGILALERLGLVDRLDRSVMWTVIHTLENYPSVRLGCNISAASLRHDGWWRLVQQYLGSHPDVAKRLTIEVTETCVISRSVEAVNLLHNMRVLGCRIAIDDMGASYSTVEFVARTRPDIIKIDRSFITRSTVPARPQNLLRHLISLCSELSTCVVAEGVETKEELDAALEAGALGVQGYFVGRPSTSPRWLNRRVTVHDSFASDHEWSSMSLEFSAIPSCMAVSAMTH